MSAAAPPARTPARAPRVRGEGQWALGFREPLNANERTKADDDGLNVRARIETIYAKAGFASIDPTDLNGGFRWWGLYTQRRPGIEGGRTAMLEPHELSDEYFMVRIHSDGGRLERRTGRGHREGHHTRATGHWRDACLRRRSSCRSRLAEPGGHRRR